MPAALSATHRMPGSSTQTSTHPMGASGQHRLTSSAVAAWLMLKRGVEMDYVFCNLAGQAYERSVVQVAKVLADRWSYGTRPRLHVVDFGAPLDELRSKARESYWQVVLKRLMYRAANLVARERKAEAIITGEAVGQVSSQTLTNLRAIEPASDLPVFRPLLGGLAAALVSSIGGLPGDGPETYRVILGPLAIS